MKDLSKLEDKLGIKFKNKDLLKQAFIHRSYLNENPETKLAHNERMEFLGDAVLELIVTEHLYASYNNAEGELTNWRAALVNSKNLARVAEGLGFNDFLLLSRGEAKDIGKARQYILANTFEAFVGALYLDNGHDAASDFIAKHVLEDLENIIKEKLYVDPKSRLQEVAQDQIGTTPTYQVLEETGPDHAKHFIVGVFIDGEKVAEGDGSSKQEAEESAAENAISVKGW